MKSFLMALGMFSTIPVPKNSWNDDLTKYVALMLFLVGALLGSMWFGIAYLLIGLNLPKLIECVIVMTIPFFLTGFLHLDGFMDTCDAILSRRDLKRMREILKSSDIGAFSVISILILFLVEFSSVFYIIDDANKLYGLVLIPIISRSIISLYILNLKSISNTGFLATFKKDTKKSYSYIVVFVISITIIISLFTDMEMFITVVSVLISALFCGRYAYKKLDGFSGDLCGYTITISEAVGLFILAII